MLCKLGGLIGIIYNKHALPIADRQHVTCPQHCCVASGDIGNGKMPFNSFPGKAKIQCQSSS